MSIPDLPWTWIAGAAAALVLLMAATKWRRGRDRGHGGQRSGRWQGQGSGHGSGQGPEYGPGAPQTGEQRALLTAANAVREALDRQARELNELRAFWSQRLDELNGRIGELARAPSRQGGKAAPDAWPGAGYGGYAGPYDSGMYGADSPGRSPAGLEPAWSPGPGDQPVEVRDGVLVASRSLPPAGYLSAAGRVYLNADVQLTEFSLPKWAGFFDLQGAKPYAAYRTIRPAEVRWDEGTGRGELVSKGLAEAI